MSNFDSLVKRPISMIPNPNFKNIKRVQLKNNEYYVDDKKDNSFEFSKLLKQYEKFLKKEYSYSGEKIPNRTIDSLNDSLSNEYDEFYCIYFGGNIAGFISFTTKFKDEVSNKRYPNTGHLRMLYVDDVYRRKGLATLALNKFESISYSRGKKEIHTFVNKKNVEGINLYKKYGFVSEGDATTTSTKKNKIEISEESFKCTILF